MEETKKYLIFLSTELHLINFDEVQETSIETVRRSIDGTKTFIEFNNDELPSFIENLTTIVGFYTYTEIVEILNTEEWTHYNSYN